MWRHANAEMNVAEYVSRVYVWHLLLANAWIECIQCDWLHVWRPLQTCACRICKSVWWIHVWYSIICNYTCMCLPRVSKGEWDPHDQLCSCGCVRVTMWLWEHADALHYMSECPGDDVLFICVFITTNVDVTALRCFYSSRAESLVCTKQLTVLGLTYTVCLYPPLRSVAGQLLFSA